MSHDGRNCPRIICGAMNLAFDADDEAFRVEARAWLALHLPREALPPPTTAAGFEGHRAWEATLFADRWSVVSWPTEYGGRDVDIMKWLIFEEEYSRAGAPRRVNHDGIALLAPALLEYGTAAQKERFLPPMASGQDIWCQGWSEPGAGDDLADVRSFALRHPDGDGWLLNGQKIWTRRAGFADWCFGIFRTDRATDGHGGLTHFLVAMDSPGITVRPRRRIDGGTDLAEIHFDNVEVPDTQVLGDEGGGWAVTMSAIGRGRGLRSPAPYGDTAARLIDLFSQRGAPATSADAIARAYMDAEAYKLHTYWTATRVALGYTVGLETSCHQLFGSEVDVAMYETALALLGSAAEILDSGSPDPGLDGYLFALTDPIAAATSAAHRGVVAALLLGRPED